nr:DUF308 domain-containing protein [Enterococcus sp. HY326]
MRKFNLGYFILGLLFIFISIISFRDPASNLVALVIFFAVMAILKGIFEIAIRRPLQNTTGGKGTFVLVMGIIDIILGIFLLFNMSAGVLALPIIFAIWFIIDSIGELMISSAFKEVSTGYYWFMVIVNILGIILGFILLFNPLSAALTLAFLVGIYFMITGITYLVAAF